MGLKLIQCLQVKSEFFKIVEKFASSVKMLDQLQKNSV